MLVKNVPRKAADRKGEILPSLELLADPVPDDKDKTSSVIFTLRVRAVDQGGPTYKRVIRLFKEGTPQEWIAFLDGLHEVWRQNAVLDAADRVAVIHTVLREDALVQFEAAMMDLQLPIAGVIHPFNNDLINDALQVVALGVFPHRALILQKRWMRRIMKKPWDMTMRKYAAAVVRINNSLMQFPGGIPEDRFSEDELIDILEFSIPAKWRRQFDLDHYVPTEHDRAMLVTNSETLERNDPHTFQEVETRNGKKQKNGKSGNSQKDEAKQVGDFYCSFHGKNETHGTKDCFTLKNRAKKAKEATDKGKKEYSSNRRDFSPKAFRKEINYLAKHGKKSKQKVLEAYATTIVNETKRLARHRGDNKPGKALKVLMKAGKTDYDSDSDSDMSVQMVEQTVRFADRKPAAKRKPSDGESGEERAFQNQVSRLGKAQDDSDSDADGEHSA
jgi:hypothetical protein